jgi:NADH-quinone oxidoreductase subunit L
MLITVTCICLFIGAMGKSAQFPLHVWLPDSMEGPTPISALIHAATMVTAGIFMVARMSPLFELSDTALNFVLVIGSITALFMGFLGHHPERHQARGGLLDALAAGLHDRGAGGPAYGGGGVPPDDPRLLQGAAVPGGGLGDHRHAPRPGHPQHGRPAQVHADHLDHFLVGSLALIGTPFLSGFYSKDSIIEAVHASHLPGAHFAAFAVTLGVFVTAFYSFRMYFLVFHGKERFGHDAHHGHDAHGDHHHGLAPGQKPHETPWVVWLPLVALAVPSLLVGYFTIEPMLYGSFFADSIHVNHAAHGAMEFLRQHFHGAAAMGLHAFGTLPFWLAAAGVAMAYWFYLLQPAIPAAIARVLRPLIVVMENKYFFDWFNENVLARAARGIGVGLWKGGDTLLIDGVLINGSAKGVGMLARAMRFIQTGRIQAYALTMILGVFALLSWKLWPYIEPQLRVLL